MSEEQTPQEETQHTPPVKQYYVDFNGSGGIVTFYVSDIHGDNIPITAVPISEEDWRSYSADARLYKLDGDVIRAKTQQELDEEVAAQPPAPPSEIELLRAENIELKLALAELAEAQEADKTETQLALAELAEIITGGA